MGKTRPRATTGITLDTGALIALDRGDRRMIALLDLALTQRRTFHVPAGVVGQAWRDGRTQAAVARFLRADEPIVHAFSAALPVMWGSQVQRDSSKRKEAGFFRSGQHAGCCDRLRTPRNSEG